ncbi:MAG TPA: nucleoside triphosphate pyrophosphohydrolase [Blastocatellia bacterium]|nr:nucleoside triphosphate pyrophosphohydrolase [Blastocatellia bacterium]
MNQKKTFQDLMEMMARLRAPEGCPWDREQNYATLAPMLIEEAYEVIEAAEAEDWAELRDELGDLLFQIVFYGQVAAESGHFDLHDSITRVHEKMTRRHPHVFGESRVENTAEVLARWEAIKAEERKAAGKTEDQHKSLLDGVSKKIPALLEAHQLTTKAARVGFDWPRIEDVFDKLAEELSELRAEIDRPERDQAAVAEEVGDLLFVAANIARQLGVEPEMALKAANRKFRRRFSYVEQRLAEQGRTCAGATLAEMDEFWNEIRAQDKTPDKEQWNTD